MKIISFLFVFVLAGFIFVSLTDYSEADFDTHGECVDFCKEFSESEAGAIVDPITGGDCSVLEKKDKAECNNITRIITQCFFVECLEEECSEGGEAPEQSVICEILDEICIDPET